MAHDWVAGVKKYVPNADDSAINGIVRHCGIALQSRDSSFVACTDKSERDRVRDSFLKKKLALGDSDAELDKAVAAVCERMKADRDKSRVAFYYLLAERYDKLALFHCRPLPPARELDHPQVAVSCAEREPRQPATRIPGRVFIAWFARSRRNRCGPQRRVIDNPRDFLTELFRVAQGRY
jgi:Protein of unknown function (DUF2853)